MIDKTDRVRTAVEERPIAALDFLATVCGNLGIDAGKQNTSPGGPPVRIIDKGATPIKELVT